MFRFQRKASFHFGKVPMNNVLSVGTLPTNNAIHIYNYDELFVFPFTPVTFRMNE